MSVCLKTPVMLARDIHLVSAVLAQTHNAEEIRGFSNASAKAPSRRRLDRRRRPEQKIG
jgi:hypothetical protein